MKNNKMNAFIAIDFLVFLISGFLIIIAGIVSLVHAFKNPTLTTTQSIIWLFTCTKWWIPVVTGAVSYIILMIFNKSNK